MSAHGRKFMSRVYNRLNEYFRRPACLLYLCTPTQQGSGLT